MLCGCLLLLLLLLMLMMMKKLVCCGGCWGRCDWALFCVCMRSHDVQRCIERVL